MSTNKRDEEWGSKRQDKPKKRTLNDKRQSKPGKQYHPHST